MLLVSSPAKLNFIFSQSFFLGGGGYPWCFGLKCLDKKQKMSKDWKSFWEGASVLSFTNAKQVEV